MRHYEVLFILKPTLTEEEVSAKLEFVKEVLTKNGAEIESVIPMGTRKLAYKIKKYERGTYFVIYFKAPTNLIAELERVLRITEEVIRFLIVKYENKKEIAAWEKLSKGIKQNKKEIKASESTEG
ncbi:TPA: 30S ribosomal protein S6 [Campylobacter lari]|nr:30S ribosomal protein S6 [Campylobacter lari]